MSTAVAYLGLGSNLGDRPAMLRAALAGLEAAGVALEAASGVYETDPVGDASQPPYLNAVVRVRTTLGPRALLATCLAVEGALGRVRPPGVLKASRTIDIDLLLHGDAVVAEADLVVPHPALLARAFVRVPLADVAAPGLRHPVTGDALDVATADPAVRLHAVRLHGTAPLRR